MAEIMTAGNVAREMFDNVVMCEGTGEKEFLLATLAIVSTSDLPEGIIPGQVIEAAFRARINPVIDSSRGPTWRRISYLMAYLYENQYFSVDQDCIGITDRGVRMYEDSVAWPPFPVRESV